MVRADKKRFMITLPEELYKKISKAAKDNTRTLSQEYEHIAKEYLDKKNKGSE